MRVGAGRAHGEFAHVRRADNHRTCRTQAPHHCGIGPSRWLTRAYCGAREGDHTIDITQILDANRFPFERTPGLGAAAARVALVGSGARLVRKHPNKRARTLPVRLRNSFQALFNQCATGCAAPSEVAVKLSEGG